MTPAEAKASTLAEPFRAHAAATLIEAEVGQAIAKAHAAQATQPSPDRESLANIPRGPEIMHHMQDGRERTANDVAYKIGCSTKSIAEQMKRMVASGYLVKNEIPKAEGPAFRVYRLP